MKRSMRLLTVCVAVLLIAWLLWSNWAQIESVVWHWRFGNSIAVGHYIVPVPRHWLPERTNEGEALILVDTAKSSWRRTLPGTTIVSVIAPIADRPPDLDYWSSHRRKFLQERGLKDAEERTIQVGDDHAVCVGGHTLRAMMHVTTDSILFDCMSARSLTLTFAGPESGFEQFQSITSQIRQSQAR